MDIAPNKTLGCDVSFWNRAMNFQAMYNAGARFVVCKASQRLIDSRFKEYWPAAKAAGLLRSAYHYLDWRDDVLKQAKLFTDTLGGDWGELSPVLDLEMNPVGLTAKEVQGRVGSFLQAVEKTTGRVPMIYCGYYYWVQWMTADPAWKKYPFWLAWYANESIIKVPPPWTNWTIWQYAGNGPGPQFGSTGLSMDMNWFRGTEAELNAFANITPTPTHPDFCPTCGQVWPQTPGPTPPPPVPPTPAYPAYKTTTIVNVRRESYKPVPPEKDNAIGTLPKDTVLYIDTYIPGGYSHFQPTAQYPSGGWVATLYLIRI